MATDIVEPRIPSGFVEFTPGEQLLFNRMLATIQGVYELFGFRPIETVAIELADVLLAKGGGDTEKQVYRLRKGNTDLALHFDLTVPLARYVAQHEGELVFPFKRYQIQKVWRGERAQKGRFREFYQCDIDVIGSSSVLIDAEIPSVIYYAFRALGFERFTILVNNRKVLNGFFEELGLSQLSPEILRAVDKIDKIGKSGVKKELSNLGIENEPIERILDFVEIDGSSEDILAKLNSLGVNSKGYQQGIEELQTLVQSMLLLGIPEDRFRVDLKIARGLDYYTGTVYETVLDDYPDIGSVCSGGRYDDLASYYTKTKLPGVGISIGLTRLFTQLLEAGVISVDTESPAQILVMVIDDDGLPAALETATELRNANIKVELHAEPDKISKKFRYADRLGIKTVALIGQKEANERQVTVKDMVTGEQETIDRDRFLKQYCK